MFVGEKICKLRKKSGLSQEELAEKIDVTRQTISKWELNETSPNIVQAKLIANLFNISLDELVGNDINDIVIGKLNNTEKRMNIIMKFIIVMLVLLLLIFITIFGIVITSLDYFNVSPVSQGIEFTCKTIDPINYYDYIINMDMDDNITSVEGNEVINFSDYKDGNELNIAISDYYSGIGGECGVTR